MLTENQIERLTILKEEFPEYSLIVDDCISTWKNEEYNPSNTNGFGVYSKNNIFYPESECCIIGAALNLDPSYLNLSYRESFAKKYHILLVDTYNITDSFDAFPLSEKSELSNKFGYKVAEIVL